MTNHPTLNDVERAILLEALDDAFDALLSARTAVLESQLHAARSALAACREAAQKRAGR